MSIRIQTEGPDTVVEFHGKLDSSLPQADRERVLSVVKPGCRLVLDVSRLSEISSAGLRMLLLFCRHVQAIGGTVSGTGVSQELKEIAEAAGFARLFRQVPTLVKRPIPPASPRLRIDAYPTHYHAGYALRPGFPIPLGATPLARGINFSIFSRHASACTLVLFEAGQREPFVEIGFPTEFRVGDVFAMIVFDLEYENIEYGFRMDGPFAPDKGHRFDAKHVLLDPMARSVSGRDVWGAPRDPLDPYPYRARMVPQDFDWEEDRPIRLPIEALAGDPVLGKTKLIAESWDAGGLYQVGSFPAYGRWAEWNGRFRDCARRFLKGDAGQVGEMASRLVGSPDLYHDRGPSASINFVTCHDGFTLADLVSYNDKHNEANGEENRDGANDNHSWNCGAEGPTDDPIITTLRRRQIKNALTLLFLSQGVPMLLMGDECGRTQQGNNNAYCHDGPLTLFDWSLLETNAELLRFCRWMIWFRARHPMMRHPLHPGPAGAAGDSAEVRWHGTRPGCPDWSPGSRVLALEWRGTDEQGQADVVYCAMNMYWEPLDFEPPSPPPGRRWHVFANTTMPTPKDVWDPGEEPPLSDPDRVLVGGRSTIVLVAQYGGSTR